jgi:asparagine synthase (glutamine-hydrolysing)
MDFVPRLRGMFAFAYYDPSRVEVLLVRDRLGIKPLYYAETDRGLLFASEVRALLASERVERRIDPVGLATYLWNGVVAGPSTLVRGVSLLPAGCVARVGVDGRRADVTRYWSVPAAQPEAADVAEARLDAELRASTEMRLLSDVPLGVFLSGGVDSSVIACLAQRSATQPIKTFNIAFDEAEFDESRHARAVAERLGTDHTESRLTAHDFRSGLRDALASLDQPTFDAVNTYFVSRAVREAGLTVALAGTGGDELFGGYPTFAELPRSRRILSYAGRSPRLAQKLAARLATRIKAGRPGELRPQTRWGKVDDALATRGDLYELYQVSYSLFTADFQRQLARSPVNDVDHGFPAARAHELRRLALEAPDLHGISTMELSAFLGERLLRDTDTTAMAVSLEVRVPIIDHKVVEAAARLPEATRFAPIMKKHVLRRRAEPELPSELFDRPKAGFVLPLELWCKQKLQGDIERTLTDVGLCDRTGLSPEAVGRVWRAFRDGSPGVYWSRVWGLFTLLWWCDEHGLEL